jgi:hypothetical protein
MGFTYNDLYHDIYGSYRASTQECLREHKLSLPSSWLGLSTEKLSVALFVFSMLFPTGVGLLLAIVGLRGQFSILLTLVYFCGVVVLLLLGLYLLWIRTRVLSGRGT